MTAQGPVPPRRISALDAPAFSVGEPDYPLTEAQTARLVKAALDEDHADNDVTTLATVIHTRRARAALVAREPGVLCGIPLALAAFCQCDDKVEIRVDVEDGRRVTPGTTVLFINGRARGVLAAERTALNFLQRLSGVASATARYVDAVRGTRARIVDTRKTTPGWRRLEKYAVRCGGGANHRATLADAVLVKDNHLAALDGDVAMAVRRAREHAPPGTFVQIECDHLPQVRAAVEAGADGVLLDNMSLEMLREAVAIADGRVLTEASGGVTLDTVRAIAETGVDRISVGALTHSAPALNLALDFE
ncbi:MAG: carboxylating nicotinate-nucleotide diphosphorylase [Gemmatimonadaceae bacterium]|nr:carboxylating nicotinate-nucleotide diphosphorylase [Gemmatimonadaceae bacterium]